MKAACRLHDARSEAAGDGAQDRAAGLVNFDEALWRGAMSKLDISGHWGVKLADIKSLGDISPWRMAVVLETSDQSARIGFQPGRELGGAVSKERQTGLITLDGVHGRSRSPLRRAANRRRPRSRHPVRRAT